MPKAEEKELEKQAKAKGLKKGSPAWNRYVYGTLNKIDKARKAKNKRGKK